MSLSGRIKPKSLLIICKKTRWDKLSHLAFIRNIQYINLSDQCRYLLTNLRKHFRANGPVLSITDKFILSKFQIYWSYQNYTFRLSTSCMLCRPVGLSFSHFAARSAPLAKAMRLEALWVISTRSPSAANNTV